MRPSKPRARANRGRALPSSRTRCASSQSRARGHPMMSGVESLSESARTALNEIVDATAASLTWGQRIADTSRMQESEVGRLSERVARIAEISRRNREGAETVTQSAVDQARALRELEGAAHELREVAADLSDLTRRIARVTSLASN